MIVVQHTLLLLAGKERKQGVLPSIWKLKIANKGWIKFCPLAITFGPLVVVIAVHLGGVVGVKCVLCYVGGLVIVVMGYHSVVWLRIDMDAVGGVGGGTWNVVVFVVRFAISKLSWVKIVVCVWYRGLGGFGWKMSEVWWCSEGVLTSRPLDQTR